MAAKKTTKKKPTKKFRYYVIDDNMIVDSYDNLDDIRDSILAGNAIDEVIKGYPIAFSVNVDFEE